MYWLFRELYYAIGSYGGLSTCRGNYLDGTITPISFFCRQKRISRILHDLLIIKVVKWEETCFDTNGILYNVKVNSNKRKQMLMERISFNGFKNFKVLYQFCGVYCGWNNSWLHTNPTLQDKPLICGMLYWTVILEILLMLSFSNKYRIRKNAIWVTRFPR